MITFRPAALKWRDDIEWKKAILQFIYRRTFDCISFQWKPCSHGSIPWNKDIQILKSKAHNRYCRTSLVTTEFCKDLHPSAKVRRRIRHEWTYTTAKPSSAKKSLHLICWVKHLRKTQNPDERCWALSDVKPTVNSPSWETFAPLALLNPNTQLHA